MLRNLNKFLLSTVAFSPADPTGGTIGESKETPPTGTQTPDPMQADLDAIFDADVKTTDADDPPPSDDGKTPEQVAAEKKAADAKAAADKKAANDKVAADAKAEADRKAAEDKTKADLKAARQALYAAASTPETKRAAYDQLDHAQKKEAYDAMSEDDRKAMMVNDPGAPPIEYTQPTMPDGVEFDTAAYGKFTNILSQIKGQPTQAQMQELVNIYTENAVSFVNKVIQGQFDKYEATKKQWAEEIKDDPDVGKARYDESRGHVARAIATFVTDAKDRTALNQALELTGAGDSLAVFKLLVAVGKAVKDDKLEIGDAIVPDDQVSAADLVFDGR